RQCIGLTKIDRALEAAAPRQLARDRDKFRREIDRRDAALPLCRKETGRAADAAAEIEHVQPGTNPCALGMIARRRHAGAVELVEGVEILNGQPVRIEPLFLENTQQAIEQAATAVMSLHSLSDLAHSTLLGNDRRLPPKSTPRRPAAT